MEILITGFFAFALTNIDDIFLLMLFFADPAFKKKDIFIGQYIGITALTAASLAASLAGLIIDRSFIGLLGLFPVYLGIRGIIRLFKKKGQNEPPQELMKNKNGWIIAVAGVTIANGGDNIGVYTPLFTAVNSSGKLIMITVFLLLTGVWYIAAKIPHRASCSRRNNG